MSGRAEPVADLREGATFGATVGPDVRSAAYPSRGASPGAAAVGLRGPRAASPRRRRAGTAWAPTEADLPRAIIGKESGDVVEVTTPGGVKAYEITKVEWV